jgi:hypothetical protein
MVIGGSRDGGSDFRIRLALLAVAAWLAVAALGAQSAGALAPGSFSLTGGPTVPRFDAAAAPLPDGRVLVAEGSFGQSAEIFDPATGGFSPTANMTLQRGGFAAAPLGDGRVLVAGGLAGSGPGPPDMQSAELFKPGLSYKLRGTKLTVSVAVAGTLRVKGTKAPPRRSAGAAGKRVSPLKSARATGGPGPITLKLKLGERAQRRLERTGKLRVSAKLSFGPAPVRGGCVTLVAPCYSRGYVISQTATLTLKAKKRR